MNNPALSRSALVADVRAKLPAEEALFLRMGDCVFEVRANRVELKDELTRYFDEFLCAPTTPDILITAHETASTDFGAEYTVKQPDPGKSKIKEQWAGIDGGRIVFKRLTGMAFVFGGGENVAVGPCLDNPNQVINFVNNRFIERMLNGGGLLGHAAGVCLNGRGLSMAGFSGMGKSTLALHCMSRGTDFVSNDRIMVREDGDGLTMYGVAKHPRINPGTALANPDLSGIVAAADRERFLALPQDELWDLEHKYDAIIADCFGPGRFYLKAPMTGLALLNWTRDDTPLTVRTVDPAEREDLLPAFMKATGLFYLPERTDVPKDPPMARYAEALKQCTVMEFSGGVDFDAAARVCLRFLETGEAPAAS